VHTEVDIVRKGIAKGIPDKTTKRVLLISAPCCPLEVDERFPANTTAKDDRWTTSPPDEKF
jgi:hypothetical protein